MDAAVPSVVHVTLTLSCAYRNTGMDSFAEALVSDGQTVPPNVTMDVTALLPSPPTVLEGVTNLEKLLRESFKETLPDTFKIGGGLNCDCLKLEANCRKHYDIIIHYI